MSEQKRATLLTISTQKGDVKKVKEKSKTIRFCLTLPESNEKSCPEYNYKDLLNSAEKKNKGKLKNDVHVNGLNPGLNHLDPFDDDDADVIRISKQFEEKYGGGIPKKRRRGNKKDDYVDIGAGYDESDSFIDNTDAYDEMVPADITTVHGGFYINSGALEFKQVEYSGSEDSSDSDKSQHSNKNLTNNVNRKRIIEDTDESESDDEKDENKLDHVDKKAKIETNGIHKQTAAKKKLVLDDNKEKDKDKDKDKEKDKDVKKRKIDENLLKKKAVTVKDLLREKREELDVTIEIDKDKENKPSGNGSSSTINDAIESVINAVRAKNVNEPVKEEHAVKTEPPVPPQPPPPAVTPIDSDQSSRDPNDYDHSAPVVKLPDNLPSHILEIINNIKKAAEKSSEGKVKFFTTPVNQMLLTLEINSRKMSKVTRISIYEHLAPFVKCKKDTLMRRAKGLLLEHENKKVDSAMKTLKTLIDNQFPVVKKSYDRECQKVRDEMFLASANAANANPSANPTTNGENGDIYSKTKRIPRKKFPWTDETRNVLNDIVTSKKKCYSLESVRKDTFETYLELFLKNTVLPLWAEGWISIAALNKQIKIITENNVKQKILKTTKTMKPITLDIGAIPASASASTFHSPVRKSPSGITVIPIAANHSPKTAMNNGPSASASGNAKPSDLSVTTILNKQKTTDSSTTNNSSSSGSVLNLSAAEISAVLPKDNSVTITSVVDARTTSGTNHHAHDDLLLKTTNSSSVDTTKTVIIEQPTNLKQRILENVSKDSAAKAAAAAAAAAAISANAAAKVSADNDDCQIIDLTESPTAEKRIKPGPKSKTRNPDGSVKMKLPKVPLPVIEMKEGISVRKTEDLTTGGNQALNHLITGLSKYGSSVEQTPPQPKETPNEDDMEQVMKDLKELQQMQEHARHDLDMMSPSSSPVSVIAYNSNYSPSKLQPDDLSAKVSAAAIAATAAATAATANATTTSRRQSTDGAGAGVSAGAFQDIFQKHLYQDSPLFKTTTTTTSSLYNSQQKTNYNSVNNFPGTISNSMNNIRYSQSSSKYPTNLSHLSASTAGATNHTDDFALFQNFLYQYGFHNSTGSKQKSPP